MSRELWGELERMGERSFSYTIEDALNELLKEVGY